MNPDRSRSQPRGGSALPEAERSDVPAPTLLMGMLTAVAAGGFVGWALLPLPTTVAGVPLYAAAAVATTLWAGLSFLRRELPTGVLAEGFYLMGLAVLSRPVSVTLTLDGFGDLVADPGAVLVSGVVAVVAATLLVLAGWRLDTHARKTRLRRMRRRVGRRMVRRRAADGPVGTGTDESDPSSDRNGNPDQ